MNGRDSVTYPRDNPAVRALMLQAAQFTPFYRDSAWAYRLRQGLAVDYDDVPLTTKAQIYADPHAFLSEMLPAGRGGIVRSTTSGSTGLAMPVFRDQGQETINNQENDRLKKDYGLRGLRNHIFVVMPKKENPPGTLHKTPKAANNVQMRFHMLEVPRILELMKLHKSEMVSSFGTIAGALLDHAHDIKFLKVITTYGDQSPDNMAALVRKVPGCRHFDSYGSEENGLIAGSCRHCGKYHVAHQNVALEVYDDDNRHVGAGGVGRVILANISNFAMPLLKYDIRDYVKLSAFQTCNETAPVLDKIVGRERTLFKLPHGGRILPGIKAATIVSLGIKRFKLVQRSEIEVELWYQLQKPQDRLTDDLADGLIKSEMSPLFNGKAVWKDEFPRAVSGKYLMHECLI